MAVVGASTSEVGEPDDRLETSVAGARSRGTTRRSPVSTPAPWITRPGVIEPLKPKAGKLSNVPVIGGRPWGAQLTSERVPSGLSRSKESASSVRASVAS